nr:T9SS type A sorting domain-containing protein [Pontibacter sp. Tf4]
MYSRTVPVKRSPSKEGLQLYPNPVRDVLYVSFKDHKAPEKIFIINHFGKVIKTFACTGTEYNYSLPVSDLQPGSYVLTTSERKETVKFLKLN